MTSETLPLIVLMPLVGAAINGLLGARLPTRMVSIIGVGAVLLSLAFALLASLELLGLPGEHLEPALTATVWSWMNSGPLDVQVAFLLDPLSMVMVLVVTGVGSLIHIFSLGYMRGDKAYWRYFSYLNLFMFSMLMLVLGKNLLILFVGWEGVGLCSYLLIGFWFDDMAKASAGKKAFITNRIGDFGFLLGIFFLVFHGAGNLDFDNLASLVGTGTLSVGTITLVCLLLFVGAAGKSAQIPLYVWLPDAMAGPTPVSALIHAATMVTAGVYMMARLNFLFVASDVAMAVIATVGAVTALFAASIALVQNDIKKVLAYSTVSQLGFMVLAIGVGGFVAAIFHLMTHAFFKACLFLGAGSVIHGMHHEQDIRQMGGLKRKLPVTAATFFVSCLAIAGVPLFAGFFSKDEILFRAFTNRIAGGDPQIVLYGVALVAAVFTAFYMFRLYYLTFEGDFRGDRHTYEHAHEEKTMTVPLVILAFLAAVGGFIGVPEALGFGAIPNVLEHWLHPVFAGAMTHIEVSHSHSLELALIAVSVAVALGGWMVARTVYKRPAASLPVAPVDAAWHRLLSNKYYVDELYDAVIIRPLKGLADLCFRWGDQKLIDGVFIHGTARLLGRLGDVLRAFHNGDVQAYATGMVVGLAVLLVFLTN